MYALVATPDLSRGPVAAASAATAAAAAAAAAVAAAAVPIWTVSRFFGGVSTLGK